MTITTTTLTEADDPMVLRTAREDLTFLPWRRLAVVGDSIAAGIGDQWPGYADRSWADRVADDLRAAHPDLAYLNTGVVGATIGDVRADQLRTALDFGPDLVHLCCGGNDLFLNGADLRSVEDDLDELCTDLTADGARLSMFTLADAFTGPFLPLRPQFSAFADIVRRVAAAHDAILTEFWAHPARLRDSWLSADHIHLTRAGHAVVAGEVTASLVRFSTALA